MAKNRFLHILACFYTLKTAKNWNQSLRIVYGSIILKNFLVAQVTHTHQWFDRQNYRRKKSFLGHPIDHPTRWSLLFIFGFLCWSSSWWWRPHIDCCKLLGPLLRAGMAVLDQFFCKMYFLYVSQSRQKNLGNFFWFYPLKRLFFFGGGQISRNSVPFPGIRCQHSFLMPRCTGCSEINKINRHLICSLLPLTSTTPLEKRPLTKTAVTL